MDVFCSSAAHRFGETRALCLGSHCWWHQPMIPIFSDTDRVCPTIRIDTRTVPDGSRPHLGYRTYSLLTLDTYLHHWHWLWQWSQWSLKLALIINPIMTHQSWARQKCFLQWIFMLYSPRAVHLPAGCCRCPRLVSLPTWSWSNCSDNHEIRWNITRLMGAGGL